MRFARVPFENDGVRSAVLTDAELRDDAQRFADGELPVIEQIASGLAPVALSESLIERLAEFCRRGPRRRASIATIRVVASSFAAAAALLLAILPRGGTTGPASGEFPVLSRADTNELLYAFSLSQWNAPIDDAIDELSLSLSDVEGALRDAEDSSVPWDGSDAWDMPTSGKTTPRGDGARGNPRRDPFVVG